MIKAGSDKWFTSDPTEDKQQTRDLSWVPQLPLPKLGSGNGAASVGSSAKVKLFRYSEGSQGQGWLCSVLPWLQSRGQSCTQRVLVSYLLNELETFREGESLAFFSPSPTPQP